MRGVSNFRPTRFALLRFILPVLMVISCSYELLAQSSAGICFVHTRGDLPKYAIVRGYLEIYMAVGVLEKLEKELGVYLTGIDIRHEEEMFPFENRCLLLDESGSDNVSQAFGLVVSDFQNNGYTVIR